MRSEVMKRKNLWQTYSEAQLEKLEKTNALYRVCLDEGKTERNWKGNPQFICRI